jgi:hypothetical protein
VNSRRSIIADEAHTKFARSRSELGVQAVRKEPAAVRVALGALHDRRIGAEDGRPSRRRLLKLGLELVRQPVVVVIEQADPPTSSRAQPCVPRPRDARVGLTDVGEARIAEVGADLLPGVVDRAVVDEDRLPVSTGLGHQAVQRALYVR